MCNWRNSPPKLNTSQTPPPGFVAYQTCRTMLGVNPVGAGIATSPCNSSTWLGSEARKSTDWFQARFIWGTISIFWCKLNIEFCSVTGEEKESAYSVDMKNIGLLWIIYKASFPGNAWVWRKWGRLFASAPFAQSWEHPNPVVMLFSLICSIWQDKFWSKNSFTLWKHKLKPFLRQCTSWNLKCHVQIDDLIIWYSRISYLSRSAASHDQPVFEDVQFPYFAASTRPHRRSTLVGGGAIGFRSCQHFAWFLLPGSKANVCHNDRCSYI